MLLGVALVLWLSGQGLGLLGRGAADPLQQPEGEASPQVVGEQPAPAAAGVGDGLGTGERLAGAGAAPAAPAGEGRDAPPDLLPPRSAAAAPDESPVAGEPATPSVGAPAAASSTTPTASLDAVPIEGAADAAEASPSRPGVDADRFHSLCSIVELRLEQGELAGAASSLARLRAQPLDAGQRVVTDDLERRLVAAVRQVGSLLHGSLQRGEVLAARPLAERWFAAREGFMDGVAAELPPPLRDAFGGELDWRRPLQVSEAAPPQPAPLDRRRRVRLDWRGELVVGSVAQARADQVTVRVETARGQSYPTVPAVACEPLDADAGEAVEMALAAVAAGEPLLARLWWARAMVLGVDAAAPRPTRLRELLR